MNRDIFVLVVKHLLELQTDGELRTWVKWAEDCVAMGQYAGFRELPQNKAVEKWLDSYYHVFSAIQSEFSKETAIKVLNLSQEKLCLYPYEMRAAARVLKAGGTRKDILQMIVEGTLEDPEPVVPEHCEKGKIEEADTWSCNTETLDCILRSVRTWQENPEIPLLYKRGDSLAEQLFNACLELLQYEFEITSIPKSDYDLISEHAFFLVNSYQVLEPEDIDLDAIFECFNDAKINERMIEAENRDKKEKVSSISGKSEKKR